MKSLLRGLSIALQAAALAAILPTGASAMEPLDMKNITDADKMYFGKRLTKEQLEKLQHVIASGFTTSKSPCEKVAAINQNLHFLNAVTPVFREASASDEISRYARKYSSSLTRELTETTKVYSDLLPRYKAACSAGRQTARDAKAGAGERHSANDDTVTPTIKKMD